MLDDVLFRANVTAVTLCTSGCAFCPDQQHTCRQGFTECLLARQTEIDRQEKGRQTDGQIDRQPDGR